MPKRIVRIPCPGTPGTDKTPPSRIKKQSQQVFKNHTNQANYPVLIDPKVAHVRIQEKHTWQADKQGRDGDGTCTEGSQPEGESPDDVFPIHAVASLRMCVRICVPPEVIVTPDACRGKAMPENG